MNDSDIISAGEMTMESAEKRESEISTRMEEIKNRRAVIVDRMKGIDEELDSPESDLDTLEGESRTLTDELGRLTEETGKLTEEQEAINMWREELRKKAREEEETRKMIAEGVIGKTKENYKEEHKMTIEEIRSSKEYINAFAEYIKTGDDKECRALLTENASSGGQVPVPTMVDDIVRHAWENENILARVRKTGFTGNVKVAFERSADPAYVHAEGATAHTEEALTLGIVEIKAENIKKWITLSDEMLEETGEGFLRYVYEELAYQVMLKLSKDIVTDITSAGTSHSSSAVGLPKVKMDPAITTIATAAANLSDEAQDICVIMNRLTEVAFLEAYAAGNFAVDPFAGLPRIYTSALPAINTASENDVYAIVGDLSAVQVNFPAGEGLKTVYDNLSLAEKDLVKIVGRVFAGHKVVAPGRLVRLTKEAAAVTT